MVAELFCLIREVIRIDADAVATDQARLEIQEIPLGACRFEYYCGIQPHFVEDSSINHGYSTFSARVDNAQRPHPAALVKPAQPTKLLSHFYRTAQIEHLKIGVPTHNPRKQA